MSILNHTVYWEVLMEGEEIDQWVLFPSIVIPYTVSLNNSIVDTSGLANLIVFSGNWNMGGAGWAVFFFNSYSFVYYTWDENGNQIDNGGLLCSSNGGVEVIVTSSTVTFVGTTTFISNVSLPNLIEIDTLNDGSGVFVSGELDIVISGIPVPAPVPFSPEQTTFPEPTPSTEPTSTITPEIFPPITISLTNLLLLDPYDNYPCSICSKNIIVEEGFIEGTDDAAFLICEFCHSVLGDITTITPEEIQQVQTVYGKICNNATNPEESDRWSYPWY